MLPEQNAGQDDNFQLLNQSGFNPLRYLISEEFPERSRIADENDAHELLRMTLKLGEDTGAKNDFLERAAKFIVMLSEMETRNQYLLSQNNAIQKHIGVPSYSSGEFIAKKIIDNFLIEENIIYDMVV